MTIEVNEEPTSTLAEYAQVSIAFDVTKVLDVVAAADERGKFKLSERVIGIAYVKNYDGFDGEGPSHWPTRFDVSHWGLFAATQRGRRVGGAVVAFRSDGLTMLENRQDLAVLWDIRVALQDRRQGVGSCLPTPRRP